MDAASIPTKFPVIFAADADGAYIRPIPTTTATPGAASLDLGFPPDNAEPLASGGVPPFIQDMNGLQNQVTAWLQWVQAGAPVVYDGTFSAAVGGYPQGALIQAAGGLAWWLSTADNNTTDPETGGGGWIAQSFGHVYAGNPNGNVAGTIATDAGLANSLLWDTADNILWLCTMSGPASGAGQAVWTQLTGNPSGNWCGVSTGTANAQIIAPPATLQALTIGTALLFIVGVGLRNTGATAITVGTFGSIALRKDTQNGPVALTGGELVPYNFVWLEYDGTLLHTSSVALGSASSVNTGRSVIAAGSTGSKTLETASPPVGISGTVAGAVTDNNQTLTSTATATYDAVACSATWAGWPITVNALGGTVSFQPNGTDTVNKGSAGAPYTVIADTSVQFVSDGISNWTTNFQNSAGGGEQSLNTISGALAAYTDTTSLSAPFPWFTVILRNIVPVVNGDTLAFRLYKASGAIVTGYQYNLMNFATSVTQSPAVQVLSTPDNSQIWLGIFGQISSDVVNGGVSGELIIIAPAQSASVKNIAVRTWTSPGGFNLMGSATYDGGTDPILGISVYYLSGNIASGAMEIIGHP